MRTYACDADQPISDCIRNIDSNAYTTFANFFTHTQNMCYFLQSQVILIFMVRFKKLHLCNINIILSFFLGLKLIKKSLPLLVRI